LPASAQLTPPVRPSWGVVLLFPLQTAYRAAKYRNDAAWLKREAKSTLDLLEDIVHKMDLEEAARSAQAKGQDNRSTANAEAIAAAMPAAGASTKTGGDARVNDLEARLRALRGGRSAPKTESIPPAEPRTPSAPAFDEEEETKSSTGPAPLLSFRVESINGVDTLILDGTDHVDTTPDLSEAEVQAAYETLRLAREAQGKHDELADQAPREDLSKAPGYRVYPGMALESYAGANAVEVPQPLPAKPLFPMAGPEAAEAKQVKVSPSSGGTAAWLAPSLAPAPLAAPVAPIASPPLPTAPEARPEPRPQAEEPAPSYESIIGQSKTSSHDPDALLKRPGAFGMINQAVIPTPDPPVSISAEPAEQESSRQMLLPASLPAAFERIAKPNTNRGEYGIETCGILCGRISKGKLVCTHLVIPKQSGTSDTVEMQNEEDLFDFCLGRDLLMLGWIHTHPRQSCFLSSVDVHTHAGYQLMLPEAVALVVAPYDSRRHVGVFHLSPIGMDVVSKCQRRGFHHHDVPNGASIYQDANVRWSNQLSFDVEDLRRR